MNGEKKSLQLGILKTKNNIIANNTIVPNWISERRKSIIHTLKIYRKGEDRRERDAVS